MTSVNVTEEVNQVVVVEGDVTTITITEGQPAVIELVTAGPQGATGAAGAQGPAGPTGPQGPAGSGSSTLAALTDVAITNQTNNSVLYYNTATNKYTLDSDVTVPSITDAGNF